MNKKVMLISLSLLLIMSLVLVGCSQENGGPPTGDEKANGGEQPAGDPVVWETAVNWPRGNTSREQLEIFKEILEEKTNGEFTLNVMGPETIPGPDQIELLTDGTLDLVCNVSAYYLADLPQASATYYLWGNREQRASSGFYDYIDRLHRERYNATLLAEYPGSSMHLFLKEPIEKLSDLKGLRFRCPPAYNAGMEELGITVMFMPDSDAVDALQSGVLDGAVTAFITYDSWNYYDVAPYTVYPPFCFSNCYLFANVDSVESLPDHLRDALYEAIKESEPLCDQYVKDELEAIYAAEAEKGLKDIYFSEEETKIYNEIWWTAFIEKVIRPQLGDAAVDELNNFYEQLSFPPEGRFIDAWSTNK